MNECIDQDSSSRLCLNVLPANKVIEGLNLEGIDERKLVLDAFWVELNSRLLGLYHCLIGHSCTYNY